MEVPKILEERKQEIIEGEIGRILLAVKGCVVYGRDEFRPDMPEDELWFDVQRAKECFSEADIAHFIELAETVAENQGYEIKRIYKWIGKGSFTDSVSKVAVCIQV